jgi:UDP-N-acetylmuramate dehydrogenase
MSAAPAPARHLIDRLPPVRGRLSAQAPLAPLTWFRVGGPADVLFRPADAADLAAFLAGCPSDVPVTVVGVASNLLIRDGGVRGVVVRLPPAFAEIRIDGDLVAAGAAALDLTVARTAMEAGIGGLEFLAGIPGTIGGAVRMNGGAYGREIRDVIVAAEGVDRQGRRITMDPGMLDLSYRHSGFGADVIVTSAVLRGAAGEPGAIAAAIERIQQTRADSQPIRARTGGSTFANPPGAKAWELIDRAGCRGLAIGGAQVSEKHCNFLLNTGTATAADLEALGEEVRRRVLETAGIALRWEIKRIGEPLAEDGAR